MSDSGNNQTEKGFYSPREAASILNVSVERLKQMRWQGRIVGTNIGNSTVYTMDQIKAADISPWPRGRKKVKKNVDDSSVMLISHEQAHQLVESAA